ncbi:52 kDa repressor of the inhibitor of the protein kinase-like [Macrobrachium rosenbergii]|uniref:52 kDa repressor of the inhibitor of the protein kinase-like n=1 Tax=Macrobrachium rosenbergii TaxID=79674 RepID=UPI0034D64E6F
MIQNELIQLLSKETEKELTYAIKAAPFYSIMLDTTQDISKIDQMCEIYRYCSIEYDDNGKPKALQINESFLGFHKVEGQSGAALSEQILQIIKQRGLSISRCRGQGYDGASNMKGIYKGVQKKITDVEPSAVYVHCAAYNLNLVINDAVKDVTEMAQFYDIVQRVYVFFGLSIKRWDILSSLISESGTHKGVTIKKLNPTRWAGRYDAVFALKVRFSVDLAKAADLLKVCMDEMCRLRNQFEDVKKEATDIAQKWSIRPEFEKKRLRTVKRHFGELCEDQRLEDPESLCRVTVYYRTLDIITTQLNFRFTGLHEVVSSFSVLEPISLQNLSDSELYEKASSFVKNTTTMCQKHSHRKFSA